MTDQELAEKLRALGDELLIKGDPEQAFVCTTAAARLAGLPDAIEVMRHPSKGADAITQEVDRVVEMLFGRRGGEA